MTRIAMLLYPGLTQLDLTGPYEVFRRISDAEVLLVWKTLDAVVSDGGMAIVPGVRMAECPRCEVLFVPGGPGQVDWMLDEEVMEWLRVQGREAQWVTSVCTGSLLLGAAGLLRGYRAACHWMSRDQLALLGATPVAERVVVDGNRVTGGGVTAGIDFALRLAGELRGEDEARGIGLQLEYDPMPPYGPGSPEGSELGLITGVKQKAKGMMARRREATERAAERLRGEG
ncbi:MAG: DJ-1/PfpI family protein [Bryobacterales bacterium]|nr:DJ-1/PfpI family protein [Bryobacterales bacterium]